MGGFPPPPDLDELLAEIRSGSERQARAYPTELPERLRVKPPPPVGVPARGIFDEALARVRGTYKVSMEDPDLFGKKYEPVDKKTAPDPGKLQADFEDQVASGAKHVAAQGGDVDEYIRAQHEGRYGPEIASMLKAGRDLASQRLTEGAAPAEAEEAGSELARRHLANLRNRLASGEAGEVSEDTNRAVEGLTSSFTTRKGLAQQGLILGVPMAAAAIASGPLGWGALGTYAATAAATAASQAASEKYLEGRAPDWESATAAGLAYSLPVPGLTELSRTGAGLESAAARRAVQTVAHAGTQAIEMPLRGTAQGLVEGRGLPTGIEVGEQAAMGAIVGGGIGGAFGLLEGQRQRISDDTAGATEIEAKPPTREVGRMAQAAADSQLEQIEGALGAARQAADLPAIQSLEQARQTILDARARGSELPVTPDPPQPGQAGPPPQAPGPAPAVPPAGAPGAPPPPGALPPGPVTGTHIRPQVPIETAAGAAGEATAVEEARDRQAGTAPQVRSLTEAGQAEAQGGPPPVTPPIVRGPTGGTARGVEVTPAAPDGPPAGLAGGPQVPAEAQGPTGPPVAIPAPAPAPPAPIPARRLKIGRGANGQIEAIFPDQNHADLFSAPGRHRRQMMQAGALGVDLPRPGQSPDWQRLSARFGVPRDLIGQAATRYRDAVMEEIRGLPEGETFVAPTLQQVISPAAPTAAPVLPPSEVPGAGQTEEFPAEAAPPAPAPETPLGPERPARGPAVAIAPPGGRIDLRLEDGNWIAHHEGQIGDEIEQAMGARAIPTPFTSEAPGEKVAARLSELNPGVEVTVQGRSTAAVAPGDEAAERGPEAPRLPRIEATRAFDPAPSAYPPWGEKAPEWWDRRVKFAKARIEERARGTTATVGVDPRVFWDAFVVGVDAIRNGLRKFGDWMTAVGRNIPNFSTWGRQVWDYIRGLNAPIETEQRGAVRPFGETAAGIEAPLFRGPIRQLPVPTVLDLAKATEALLEGRSGAPVDVGAGKPLGIGVPDDLAINIHQVSDEAGIRESMARIVRAVENRFDLARKKFTASELHSLALRLGYDEADYLRMIRQKGALTAPEIIAGRVLRQHAGVDFSNKFATWNDAVARVKEPGLSPDETYRRDLERLDAEREHLASLHKFVGMMYGTAAAGSEAGRALWAHKLLISTLTPEEQFMRRLMRSGRADVQQMAALAAALQRGDHPAVSRLVRRIYKPGFAKMAIEYFINSLLSAPPTFVANVAGNLVHEAVMRTPERGLAAQLEKFGIRQGVERLLTGEAKPTERVVGQAMEALRAQVRHKFGIFSALDMARLATTKEDLRFLQSVKQEVYVPAIPGVLGKVVRTPGRVMEALDVGAKINAAAAEQAAQLFFKAYQDAGGAGIGSPEFKAHLADLHALMDEWKGLEQERVADPQEFQRHRGAAGYQFLYQHRDLAGVYKAMQRAADVSTFRDETTRFTNFVKQMRGAYPWLSFIVPFVHTTERILVQGFRRTPLGLVKSLYNIQQGKLSGGEASDRLAQGMLGSLTAGAIYALAADGLVSGGGPDDPKEREQWMKTGRLPYAIRVGDEWISYARVEPFATIFGFAADLAEAKNEKTAGDAFGKLHYAVLNNITNKTYLEGMVSAAEAIGNPDRYMSRYWKRSLGALVPNLLATAARAIDPTIRETDDFSQVLMSRVPILSEQLPARLTGTGEPVIRGEAAVSRMLSPVRYSEEAGPEKNLERWFLAAGYSPSQPPRSITLPGTMGRKVELLRQEREIYAAYAQRASGFARNLTQNRDWSRLDANGRGELLRRIFRFADDSARRDVLASTMNRLRSGQAQVAPRR